MANQMTITFNVENQLLRRTDTNRIVEKSKNYLHANFTFSADWDNTTKAVIIENGGMRFKVYLEKNECDIPNRAVSHDGFTITIVGEDSEKFITITTTDLFIAVQKNNASDIQEEYIKNITSDTLDLTRNGENCNIEIPSEYVTDSKLSQELENYVDNESLEETLEDYVKETDLSDYATKQELNGKSTVIPNPTMSGDEPTLEGAEIDGIKYKVGGGSGKSYEHIIALTTNDLGSLTLTIPTIDNTPFTIDSLLVYLNSRGHNSTSTALSGVSGISGSLNYVATGVYRAGATTFGITYIYYSNNGLGASGTGVPKNLISSFTDTVTEV